MNEDVGSLNSGSVVSSISCGMSGDEKKGSGSRLTSATFGCLPLKGKLSIVLSQACFLHEMESITKLCFSQGHLDN